jgi:hypothetical protein
MKPNHRSPLDARTALCQRIEDHWPGASERERSMNRTLTAIAAGLLMLGCRSVPSHKASIAYPPLPAPLGQFLKKPSDGVYSLPEPVASGSGIDLKVVIVTGAKIRLTCLDDCGIGTNAHDFVEFKSSLPPEDAFQQIAPRATEQQIEECFGRPTWEQNVVPEPNGWGKRPSDTRVVYYQWCTLSRSSELVFMRLTAIYTLKDGIWLLRNFNWAKWQNRKLSSNHSMQPTGARRRSTRLLGAASPCSCR